MDKFPEAFNRFAKDVNVNRIKSFKELELQIESWAGQKWKGTPKQIRALAREAKRLGIPLHGERIIKKWLTPREQQQLMLKEIEREQTRERFSRNYGNFQEWQNKTARTTAYQRRIINYLRNHPNANLQQARGHAKR